MERLPFYLFFICAGFLSGSIAYSYFLPKLLLHKNILLLSDDGNPGCANVFKYIGVPMGILCLLCDFFKGYLPIMWALHFLEERSLLFSFVLAAPTAGHMFSPFLHFHGGKAINVSFGCLTALLPAYGTVWWLVIPFIALSTLFRLNPHSLRVVASFAILFLLSVFADKNTAVSCGVFLISALVTIKHTGVYLHHERSLAKLQFLNHTLWKRKKKM